MFVCYNNNQLKVGDIMIINKAYKFRLYPTLEQQILINKNTEVENRYSGWDPDTQYDKDAVYSWIKILRYTSPNAEYNDYEKMKSCI